MANEQLSPALKQQVDGLMRYMDRLRREIAAIDHPVEEEHQLDSTGPQLDAIVRATEEATNVIMDAVDRNEEIVADLRKRLKDPDLQMLLEEIIKNDNDVFEACTFQDISGQRVNKVIKSISYIEKRINALIDIWGKAYLFKVKVASDMEESDGSEHLSGPQLSGQGLSQDDIDKLFD